MWKLLLGSVSEGFYLFFLLFLYFLLLLSLRFLVFYIFTADLFCFLMAFLYYRFLEFLVMHAIFFVSTSLGLLDRYFIFWLSLPRGLSYGTGKVYFSLLLEPFVLFPVLDRVYCQNALRQLFLNMFLVLGLAVTFR